MSQHFYHGPTVTSNGITPGHVVYVEKAQPLPQCKATPVRKASPRPMTLEEAYDHLGIRRPRSLVTKATTPAANLTRYMSGRWG